jgi:hypothetical protein
MLLAFWHTVEFSARYWLITMKVFVVVLSVSSRMKDGPSRDGLP